jgi:hypothetical protein
MGKSSDAYEQQSEGTGFGAGGQNASTEHRPPTTPYSGTHNEVDPEEGHRANQQHARSTHQDTRITEAEGLKRLRRK